MRSLLDIFVQIFRNLWAHKLRSFLTMFGIAWGVGSLLLLVGVGEGFRSGNKREMAEFGKDIMFIFPGRAPAVCAATHSAASRIAAPGWVPSCISDVRSRPATASADWSNSSEIGRSSR